MDSLHPKTLANMIQLIHHFIFLTSFTLIYFPSHSHQSPFNLTLPPLLPSPKLLTAYSVLHFWKNSFISDPKHFTANWVFNDLNVCNYNGIYCAPSPHNPAFLTVAGIDLNHAGISGYLPEGLGFLTDLALFHINSNNFFGTLPRSFAYLSLLHELDVSNNEFSGEFPDVVFSLPSLKFLDLRFNSFTGEVPNWLFDMDLDAIFINNNEFDSPLPEFGNSPASVIVLANNKFTAKNCVFNCLSKMAGTLKEIILMNVGLKGCLVNDIGVLKKLTVFDVSYNELVGQLPERMGEMRSLEQLNVAHNRFSGEVPRSICSLPNLENFTYSDNYLCGEPPACTKLLDFDDRKNCIAKRPLQRSTSECTAFYSGHSGCGSIGCSVNRPESTLIPAPPSRSQVQPPEVCIDCVENNG